MKITIGGSMTFAAEQIEAKKKLEERGFEVLITDDIEHYVERPAIKMNFEEELALSLEYDVMRVFFNKIASSDAFLVMNHDKKGVSGYIGTSALMEMGVAFHLGKKIFLLKDFDRTAPYAVEAALTLPIILNGDLDAIK